MLVVVGLLCLGAGSSPAKPPRQASLPYEIQDVNHSFGGPVTSGGVWDTEYAYVFELNKGEKHVFVNIVDDSERTVAGAVVQWTTDFEAGGASSGHAVTYARFCGYTPEPVPVVPDIEVEIKIFKGTCEDGTASVPSSGDIVADFYRKVAPTN